MLGVYPAKITKHGHMDFCSFVVIIMTADLCEVIITMCWVLGLHYLIYLSEGNAIYF